jgi:hypothetical protein
VEKMLRRQGLHWTGVVEPKFLKEAGKWLKADYLLAGKLRWGGDGYILSAHVMDVKTLETTLAEDVDFKDLQKMRIAVRRLAQTISSAIDGSEAPSSKAALFLKIDPRAFYDTADACVEAMAHVVDQFRFQGTVEASDESNKSIQVKGQVSHLKLGIPLDVFSTSGIDEPTKIVTVYISKLNDNGFEARYRLPLAEGVELGAKVSNYDHPWTVMVGQLEDEAEDDQQLITRFRDALQQKMSEGDKFQQIEGDTQHILAQLANARTRSSAFKKLYGGGIELVLEGKFYGARGAMRAHFKIYATQSGKLLGEPKFETQL